MEEPVLAVDIGSGTQDILVYLPGRNLENCPKLVMPSRTQIVGAQIRKVTALNQDLFLTGNLMGGGASTAAVKAHVRKGLKAYATKDAAKTFHDDLNVVKKMGIELVEKQPEGTERIVLADLDLAALQQALTAFDLELPSKVIAALQDHGECLEGSNREFRFKKWQEFILNGGELSDLVYREAPGYLTRMCALQKAIPHAYVMDTGAAAVWGALCDPVAGAWRERGLLVVNIGNSHTLGVAIKGSRILAVFEHHTGQLDSEFLAEQVRKLQAGSLTNAEVFAAGGHGAFLHPEYHGGFEFVALSGPRWDMAKGFDFYRVAPFGDMMLTGSFGLIAALGLIR